MPPSIVMGAQALGRSVGQPLLRIEDYGGWATESVAVCATPPWTTWLALAVNVLYRVACAAREVIGNVSAEVVALHFRAALAMERPASGALGIKFPTIDSEDSLYNALVQRECPL